MYRKKLLKQLPFLPVFSASGVWGAGPRPGLGGPGGGRGGGRRDGGRPGVRVRGVGGRCQPATALAGVGQLVFVGAEPARIKSGRNTGPEVAGAPRAYLVTQYRYADDTTIYTTVDAATNRVLARREAQHVPTPVTAEELAVARELALGNPQVREALGADAGKLTVEALGLYSDDRSDRIYGHRAMSLLFRNGALYRAGVEVIVDLTARTVTVTRRAPNDDHP